MMTNAVIAIVDDDPVITGVLEEELGDAGYSTVVYHRGIDAHRLVRLPRLDLVLLDLWLDEPNASSMVLALLKHAPHTRDVPIILMSGDSNTLKERQTVLEAKGYGFLDKPFDLGTVLALVSEILRAQRPARE